MTILKLALQHYDRDAAFTGQNKLVNLLVEQDPTGANTGAVTLIQRPGLTPYSSLPGVARGLFYDASASSQDFVAAVNDRVVRFSGAGISDIGAIANDGKPVRFASNYFHTAIVSAGAAYLMTGNTISQLAIPDNKPINDVASVDNYLVFSSPDGFYYWIFPGEDTIDPLSFQNAESLPDGLVSIQALNSDVFLFGTNSVEVIQTSGDGDDAFRRASGRNFSRGLKSRHTVQVLDNQVVFVGTSNQVYMVTGSPIRISNDFIEEKIMATTAEMTSIVITSGSHELYVLNLPGQGSFAYDASTKIWCEFKSTGSSNWRPRFSADSGQRIVATDSLTGKVWYMDTQNNSDDGLAIERTVNALVPLSQVPTQNYNLTIRMGCDKTTALQFRFRDGEGPWRATTTLNFAPGSTEQSVWRLGYGRAPYREFELTTSAFSRVAFQGVLVNEGQKNRNQ